jgi:hypothetical protein
MRQTSQTGGFGTSDWLTRAVKNNPEGLLLLAAGCALLLRSGSSGRRNEGLPAWSGDQRQDWSRTGQDWSRTGGTDRGVGEKLSQATQRAREWTSDVAGSVSSYADETRRTVSDQSERFAQQAQSTFKGTVSRVLQEQPLAVGLVGLAAGAAVAAAFPRTEMEKETLGQAGEWVTDAAARTGEQLKDAAGKAGERLATIADERGLSVDGLKDAATEVAGAFESSLSGGQSNQSTQSGSQTSIESKSPTFPESPSSSSRPIGQSNMAGQSPGPGGGSTQSGSSGRTFGSTTAPVQEVGRSPDKEPTPLGGKRGS